MDAGQTIQADRSAAPSPAEDAAAWLAEHGDVLYRYACARVGNRDLAEDLVQETLLAALQAHDRFQGRATVQTWLLSIIRHKIIDHHRRTTLERARADASVDGRADAIHDRYFDGTGHWKSAVARWKAPDQALEDREFWDVLHQCVRRMPRSLSSVFLLRELENLEFAELSRSLNLTEGNLRVRLHRARLLLRECLTKNWFHESSAGSRSTP